MNLREWFVEERGKEERRVVLNWKRMKDGMRIEWEREDDVERNEWEE